MRERRLPDWLTLPLVAAGLLLSSLESSTELLISGAGAALGFAALWFVRASTAGREVSMDSAWVALRSADMGPTLRGYDVGHYESGSNKYSLLLQYAGRRTALREQMTASYLCESEASAKRILDSGQWLTNQKKRFYPARS